MRPIRLHSESFGDGEPLVIAHGLFGSGTNWRTLARRFAEQYHVVLLDARNHGRSPHCSTMSYAEMAADLSCTLDGLGLSRVHLIGHSMGGKAAMTLATTNPDRVRSLVVADVAPIAYDHDFDTELHAMKAIDAPSVERRRDADERLSKHLQDPLLRAFLLQNLVQTDGKFSWRVNLAAIEAGVDVLTGSFVLERPYEGPALFLRGANSQYVPDSAHDAIKTHFPRAQMLTIENAGHWLHAEQPDAFVDAATRFLSKHIVADADKSA
jgi:esterase